MKGIRMSNVPYKKQRANDVAEEIAELVGLEYNEKLQQFYDAAYDTAVYDIATENVDPDRERVILDAFALTEKKS